MSKELTGITSRNRFASRVALITGAGSGIGRVVAERFAAEGASVALIGRTRSKLDAVAADFPPESTAVFAGSHEDESFVERAVDATVSSFGRIDVLFNNAGIYDTTPVEDCDSERWNGILAANLTGPFLLSREVLKHMTRNRSGVIINNSSTLGLAPIPGAAAYCVSKAALIMLTRAMAVEVGPYGVRVNAICPGVVDTPIHGEKFATRQGDRNPFLESIASMHPLGRIGTPDDIAELVLFLASDESRWTSGAVVAVDGGISLT